MEYSFKVFNDNLLFQLKVDCSEESQGSQNTVKETGTEGPVSDESRVQDSTIDSSQGQKNNTCDQTETQGSIKCVS